MSKFLQLFLAFFKLGAFSFGGGYAMIPLMESEIIEKYGWLTSEEFVDIIAISEMTPGPIAVNSATFLGYRVAGVLGSAVATLGVVLPSFIIMSFLMYFLKKYKNSKYIEWFFVGVRPIVIGLVASAAVTVGRGTYTGFKPVLISLVIFYLVSEKKLNAIYGIILAGVMGLVLF